jgi:hypothetical protein
VELVEATSDLDLNRALLDALRRWRFSPAMREGRPVASTVSRSSFRFFSLSALPQDKARRTLVDSSTGALDDDASKGWAQLSPSPACAIR